MAVFWYVWYVWTCTLCSMTIFVFKIIYVLESVVTLLYFFLMGLGTRLQPTEIWPGFIWREDRMSMRLLSDRSIISSGTLSTGVFVSKLVCDAAHFVILCRCVFACKLTAWHFLHLDICLLPPGPTPLKLWTEEKYPKKVTWTHLNSH